jgi:hypothetical protein
MSVSAAYFQNTVSGRKLQPVQHLLPAVDAPWVYDPLSKVCHKVVRIELKDVMGRDRGPIN